MKTNEFMEILIEDFDLTPVGGDTDDQYADYYEVPCEHIDELEGMIRIYAGDNVTDSEKPLGEGLVIDHDNPMNREVITMHNVSGKCFICTLYLNHALRLNRV